ncbi:hypothetical protein [Sphingosinicella sp.]|uniref:hypothetical protein n=1 Tax=Sphingosinicella sp. TaxID=1917971 RepID=UPI0035AE1185
MQTRSHDPERHDRIVSTLIRGLSGTVGVAAATVLAARFLKAEEADVLWEARLAERWIGRYESLDREPEADLDRLAIIGKCGRDWFVAIVIVDGEGHPDGLIGRRNFSDFSEARRAFNAR